MGRYEGKEGYYLADNQVSSKGKELFEVVNDGFQVDHYWKRTGRGWQLWADREDSEALNLMMQEVYKRWESGDWGPVWV